jgi:hypothetical protein
MCWRPSSRARSTTRVGTAGGHEFVTGLLLASDNRPTGEMIESKGLRIEL